MKVGVVGLGVMGAPMAANLGRRFETLVYDVDRARGSVVVDLWREIGGSAAVGRAGTAASAAPAGHPPAPAPTDSVAKVAGNVDVILLSLPTSGVVRTVVTREILPNMREGGVVIDTSTTEPAVSREVGENLVQRGIGFLDAPVSGGENGARAGSLSIMVGGDEATLDKCTPVLESIGASVVHIGTVGMGGVAKLVNNLIVGITFGAISEGFSLAAKSGIEPDVLYRAIRGGWAGSTVLEVAAPAMIAGDYTPGGTVDIHWKDLGYALSLAKDQDVPTPLTALAHEVFKAARASGRGGLSQPAIVQLWEDLLGIRLSKDGN